MSKKTLIRILFASLALTSAAPKPWVHARDTSPPPIKVPAPRPGDMDDCRCYANGECICGKGRDSYVCEPSTNTCIKLGSGS